MQPARHNERSHIVDCTSRTLYPQPDVHVSRYFVNRIYVF